MQTYSRRLLRLAIPLISVPFLTSIVASQGRAAGERERAINESENPLLAVFQFRLEPVLDVMEAVAAESDAITWRDSAAP